MSRFMLPAVEFTHRFISYSVSSNFMMGGRLAIEIVAVDHWAVVNLADEIGLTTYDASELWLAGRLKGELITLDGKMQRAAKSL